MFRLKALLGGLLVLFAVAAVLAHDVRKDARWDPDGFLYARMMLVDTGLSADDAHREASRFFLTTPAAHDPDARDFYGASPPGWYEAQYPLFRARPLFPKLASLAYPRLGFRALKDVAAAGVVIAAVALYVLLLLVAPPWLAALGAIAAAGAPLVRDAATMPMTDGVALAWWTIALGAIAFYARRPTRTALAMSLLAAVLLALTRPAIWLPVGAAAGLAVAAYRSGDAARRRAALTMLAGQVVVAAGTLVYTAAVGGAGFFTLQRWSYDWQTAIHGPYVGHGVGAWYAAWIAHALVIEPASLLARGVPLLALGIAVVGVLARRRDAIVPVLLGVACAAPLAIVANPPDFQRALELPLTPVVLAGVAAAVAAALPAAGRAAAADG
jgi:hypothetical protein